MGTYRPRGSYGEKETGLRAKVHTPELLEAVGLVAGVIPSNPPRPILQCVHITAEQNRLRVEGTDLDCGLCMLVEGVEVDRPGAIAIHAGRFHAILRELHNADTLLDCGQATQLRVQAGSSEFKVPTDVVDEFPAVEFEAKAPTLHIRREPLLIALRRVVVAAARDATRYQMHSVLFDCGSEQVHLVSTDGKRMAIADLALERQEGDPPAGAQFIIPLKGVDLLVRVLSLEGTDMVGLHFGPTKITYVSDRISLMSRLVDGRYPPYERAIPVGWTHTIDFPADELQSALRQAALMTTKETNSVHFSFQGNRLVLSTHVAAVGESRIELEVNPVEGNGEEFSITFNPYYMLDLIKSLDAPVLRGHFKDGKTAGLFSLDGEGDSYRHIVMPLVTGE